MTVVPLSTSSARAIAHVAARAQGAPLDPTLRVTVHLHPDRLHHGEPLLAVIARDGVLRSQFETGTSNGGLTAYVGGARWQWESRMFGGAYDDAPSHERPIYGALNVQRRAIGASPRFGSAHLRLAGHTLARTTFCFPDSYYEPVHFGVVDKMTALESAAREANTHLDALDRYIEAHVHGGVRLRDDVEALVLDPSHRGSDVERLAHTLGVAVEWHAGFRLHVDVLAQHADYRGATVVELGRALAHDGWLRARDVDQAAHRTDLDPQNLKRLWHCIACFGAPDVL
jgi:hypothetical protein